MTATDESVTTETTETVLGELLTADLDGGFVVRPGDVLLLGGPATINQEQMEFVRDTLRERLPQLADVLILGGLTIQGVFRDDRDPE